MVADRPDVRFSLEEAMRSREKFSASSTTSQKEKHPHHHQHSLFPRRSSSTEVDPRVSPPGSPYAPCIEGELPPPRNAKPS